MAETEGEIYDLRPGIRPAWPENSFPGTGTETLDRDRNAMYRSEDHDRYSLIIYTQ
jgi:hypothetical protein